MKLKAENEHLRLKLVSGIRSFVKTSLLSQQQLIVLLGFLQFFSVSVSLFEVCLQQSFRFPYVDRSPVIS